MRGYTGIKAAAVRVCGEGNWRKRIAEDRTRGDEGNWEEKGNHDGGTKMNHKQTTVREREREGGKTGRDGDRKIRKHTTQYGEQGTTSDEERGRGLDWTEWGNGWSHPGRSRSLG